MALICCAVALPFTAVIAEAFATSSEAEFPELQLTWPLKYRVLQWRRAALRCASSLRSRAATAKLCLKS